MHAKWVCSEDSTLIVCVLRVDLPQGVFFNAPNKSNQRQTLLKEVYASRNIVDCCLQLPSQVEPGKKISSDTASKLILGNNSLLNEAFSTLDLNKAVQIATTVIQEILEDSSINGSLRTEVGKYFDCLLSKNKMPIRTNVN